MVNSVNSQQTNMQPIRIAIAETNSVGNLSSPKKIVSWIKEKYNITEQFVKAKVGIHQYPEDLKPANPELRKYAEYFLSVYHIDEKAIATIPLAQLEKLRDFYNEIYSSLPPYYNPYTQVWTAGHELGFRIRQLESAIETKKKNQI